MTAGDLPMTVEIIRERLDQIRRAAVEHNDEKAHNLEDVLHQDVLRYFAATGNRVAQTALESLDIDFARCCA
jgi:hypothetical protein